MEEFTEIKEYIRNLKFKKKTFGCDEEDVLLKMKELSDLYEHELQRIQHCLQQAEAQSLEMQVAAEAERKGYQEKIEQLNRRLTLFENSQKEIFRQTKELALKEAENIQQEMQELQQKKERMASEYHQTKSITVNRLKELSNLIGYIQSELAESEKSDEGTQNSGGTQ